MKFRVFPGMVGIIAIAQALIWQNFWITFAFLLYFVIVGNLTHWALRVVMRSHTAVSRQRDRAYRKERDVRRSR